MDMFTSYQADLINIYNPNNLMKSFHTPINNSKLSPIEASKPYQELDAKGNQVGYFWHQGETINLEFNIEGEITVESDAFISRKRNEVPEDGVANYVGQKFYNIIDKRSWQSYSVNHRIVWVEDEEFTYPESGLDLQHVYMPAAEYIKDKSIVVTLFNFRMEPIYTWHPVINNSKVVCKIDKELSSSLHKGIYYCIVTVEDEVTSSNIFNSTDCVLLVK